MSAFRKNPDPSPQDSRHRQLKKDDAIRRKIEHELSKKRSLGSRVSRRGKALPGTVMYLKPSEPIICKISATVYEAAQLMSARRENCILVVNDHGELIGIFTAKDLAFRIVGSGLSATTVTIDQIMTPSPLCANSNSPAAEALTLMVEKGFRHLPVLDDQNRIVGVLDITKSYAQQMEKLEKLSVSSKKLHEALDNVHLEIGLADQSPYVLEYFASLKSKMDGPTLLSVLDHTTSPVYATIKTSVYEATLLMKENRTTAVLVKDTNDVVSGIFTSKDVVLRVIAAGLDPRKCSLVRVMTPQPDVANYSFPIQSALRQMFDGHFLNLPVVGDNKEIIGIVDVLKLTYATLNQIKKIELTSAENSASNSPEEGPAWNKFWTSLDNDDSDSMHSDSITSAPDVTPSEFRLFNVDIRPSDSISAVEESMSSKPADSSILLSEETFIFKFKSPAVRGRVHRVSVKPNETLEDLRRFIDAKLHQTDYEALKVFDHLKETYAISYIDDEGDVVSITSNEDLRDCVKVNRDFQSNKADLYLHSPNEAAPVDLSRRPGHNVQPASGELISGIPNYAIISGVLCLASALTAVMVVSNKR
ncbi:CBS-domain-containing protein [Metschnikowia bicuspidata var. bicuspidata NRRL YB-4993]|uniref:CBS-domain-containing protein n=1 Tax=Metschnikowia bicuspidata var. bicuspidata NRRL YB-4993 TaxID=869754 RepID=A0A1A0H4Y8_9ASCO|nr:CBS-domain-containing protein [Metschnikowia bicuspidata var. bicuspidata NRRL YB-4993]OBA19101.1 CBS-domain-containing protein [Metschnikowia bicuspidata var. bicuspidata NRRL YB-4993]